jgi:hypothetical protein|tara:strand:+ start:6632 stop:7300 length:669 start_codon:yes stop_codon:yes gene_type:complete
MALTTYTHLDSADASLRVFPTTVKPVQISVNIEQPTMTSTTNALTTQRRTLGTHRIKLEYTYPPMTADEMQPFIGFFNAMQGQAKAFKLNVPKELINDTTHITDSDVKDVTTSYAVGSREVVVDNFTNNLTTAIKGGNFIQFDNHDKVYVVAADGGSHASNGTCNIRFEPGLLTAVTSDESLNRFSDDIPLHAIFANSTIEFDVSSALLYGFKIKFIEQWTN